MSMAKHRVRTWEDVGPDAILHFHGRNAFLSNFALAKVDLPDSFIPLEGAAGNVVLAAGKFSTAEHAYQFYKTENLVWQDRIRDAATPAQAKKYGRQAPIRDHWDAVKEIVMLSCLRAKFTQNKRLREKLLETGERILIEGNGWGDRYWGVCNGRGKNRLGVLIMQVRGEIASGDL